jgi:hypothetical protein
MILHGRISQKGSTRYTLPTQLPEDPDHPRGRCTLPKDAINMRQQCHSKVETGSATGRTQKHMGVGDATCGLPHAKTELPSREATTTETNCGTPKLYTTHPRTDRDTGTQRVRKPVKPRSRRKAHLLLRSEKIRRLEACVHTVGAAQGQVSSSHRCNYGEAIDDRWLTNVTPLQVAPQSPGTANRATEIYMNVELRRFSLADVGRQTVVQS